jgi:hypothetical protein
VGKEIVVVGLCQICQLPNVAAINKDLVQRRNFREVIGRHKLFDQLENHDINEINKLLMEHFRDHFTTPAQAMANHVVAKEVAGLKNTVVEANLLLDQIDVFSVDVLDRLSTIADDGDWSRVGKIYSDLLKRKLDNVVVLHKITGKEKADEVKGAMMTSYFDIIAKKLGEEKVAELKQRGKKKGSPVDRAEYVTQEDIDDLSDLVDEELGD